MHFARLYTMSMPSTKKASHSDFLDLEVERLQPFRIDPHCHILPGVDDGAPDPETSLRMGRRAAQAGIEVMVATPHACHPAVKCPINADILRQKAAALNELFQGEGVPVTVLPGQEFLMDERLPEMFEAGELITWADQEHYVLVELGFHRFASCTWEVLDYFRERGLTPIIAHPERYTWWEGRPEALDGLLERDCWLQFNVMSLNRLWGDEAYERALRFMASTSRWIVGTDSHSDADRYWGIEQVRALIRSRGRAQG